MGQIIEQNIEIHVEETSASSLSDSVPEVSHVSSLPALVVEGPTPAHPASLADRARRYLETAGCRTLQPGRFRINLAKSAIF